MRFLRSFLFVFIVLGVVHQAPAQSARSWQDRAPMPTARTGIAAVVVDDIVYVMGGLDEDGNILDVVETYDPESNTWGTAPNLRTARYNFAAVVYDEYIFVLGGHDDEDESSKKVEIFSFSENRWESFDNLEVEREGLGAVVLNEELYVMGGANGSADFLSSVEILDTDQQKWEVSTEWELDIPRALFGYVAVDDIAYTVGGFSSFGPTGLVQGYDEDEGTRNLSPISPGRGGLAMAYLDDTLLAMGGRRSDNQVVSRVDRFSPSENRWENAPEMSFARERFAAVSVDDDLFVFGGNTSSGEVLNNVEVFTRAVEPSAMADILITDEDVEQSINVLVNDIDPAGGTLSISGFSQPKNGTVTQLDPNTFNYQPNPNFFGSDPFTYTVLNETGGSAQATVNVTVRPINDPPVFLSIPVTGASQNALYTYSIEAADIDADQLTINASMLPDWLTLTDQQDGSALLTGTPFDDDLGEHEVVLVLSDGLESPEQRFVITVIEGLPGQALLLFPANGAQDVPGDVTLSWSVPGAVTYDVQVGLDRAFIEPVAEGEELNQAFWELTDLTSNTSYFWRVRGVNAAGKGEWAEPFEFITAIDTANEEELPGYTFRLDTNYPNPFTQQTQLPFTIITAGYVELHIFDIRGRLVITLDEGFLNPGNYNRWWNGTDGTGQQVASGSYFAQLTQGAEQVTRIITLIR